MDIDFSTPIEFLRLKERPYNALVRDGITTVGDLVERFKKDMIKDRDRKCGVKGVGVHSIKSILETLRKHGFKV